MTTMSNPVSDSRSGPEQSVTHFTNVDVGSRKWYDAANRISGVAVSKCFVSRHSDDESLSKPCERLCSG